jgi:hypothetical protein
MQRNPRLNRKQAALAVWLAPPEARARFDAATLAPDQRLAWQRLRSERRRRDWEVSRALRHGVDPEAVLVHSLSHSHGYAALAACSQGAVGVDVEACTPRDISQLAPAVLKPGEAEFVLACTGDEDRAGAFYSLWVLKEACAKALRKPLWEILRLADFSSSIAGRSSSLGIECAEWAAWVYRPRPGLRLGLFVAGPHAGGVAPSVAEWPVPAAAPWQLVLELPARGAACHPVLR